MRIKKFMFCASVCILVSAISVTGQAAEQQQDKKTEAKAPIVIEADKLSFSDLTGDLFADGHVSVVQNSEKLLTESMRGNSKQTEFWIDGKADFLQLGTKLTGTGTHYNYTKHSGSMHDVIGIVGKEHVSGKTIDMLPGEMIIHNGTMTKCPAKVPDYHVSAEKIEIWPGDKMIAYNAKFWIKDKVIFSLGKYQTSLQKGAKSTFPRVGYNSDDGFYIRQYLEYPIANNIAAFTDLGYYSKTGFKPQYGLINREKSYSISLIQGDYQDSDNNWIKKEPELRYDLYSRRLGNLPVSYTFSAIYGKWTDTAKTSWHQDYNLYFTRDTINLSKTLFLNMGAGVEQIRESYNSSVQNSFKFNTSLTKVVSPKLTAWTAYNYTQNNASLFAYDSTSLSKELISGFSYKVDRMNTVGYSQSYNLQNKQAYSNTYTWNRDLHCWQLAIAYTTYSNTSAEKNKITWDLSTTRW